MVELIRTLSKMQNFNRLHRFDDTADLYPHFYPLLNFQSNSEGPFFWLAMILTIK